MLWIRITEFRVYTLSYTLICFPLYLYEISKESIFFFEREGKVRLSQTYQITGSHGWTTEAG